MAFTASPLLPLVHRGLAILVAFDVLAACGALPEETCSGGLTCRAPEDATTPAGDGDEPSQANDASHSDAGIGPSHDGAGDDGGETSTGDAAARDGPIAEDAAPPDAEASPDASTAGAPHVDISVEEVRQWMLEARAMTIVDVREPSEYVRGHLEGAVNLPWNSGVLRSESSALDDTHPIVVYCASGNRSNAASTFLADRGVRLVYDMGGIGGWVAAGYPVVQ